MVDGVCLTFDGCLFDVLLLFRRHCRCCGRFVDFVCLFDVCLLMFVCFLFLFFCLFDVCCLFFCLFVCLMFDGCISSQQAHRESTYQVKTAAAAPH